MNRRQFISRSAALLAAGAIANQELFAGMAPKLNKGRIGIQLYSIRNDLPKDFEGSLKKLSAIGYSQVETYSFDGDKFFGRTMKEVSDIVTGMGMSIESTHCGTRMLPEDTNAPEWDAWKKICDQLKIGGGKWTVLSSLPGGSSPKTFDGLKRITDQFSRMGAVCKQRGVKFAFHNHAEVFERGERETIIEYLIKNTDPELVFFQLDMGHTINGGGNILQLMRTYPKRIPLWHASDYDSGVREYTGLGQGNVPYKLMFDLPDAGGLELLTVEQERTGDIFAMCKADFDFLKQFKWTGV